MAVRPALFRILLATLLLLNVVGTAAAGALHAGGGHGAMPPQHATAAADCHGGVPAGADHESPPAPAPDCCGDGACTTCTGFAHAVTPHVPALAPGWAARSAPPDPAPGYANAALQRMVRPPIG